MMRRLEKLETGMRPAEGNQPNSPKFFIQTIIKLAFQLDHMIKHFPYCRKVILFSVGEIRLQSQAPT